MRFEWNRVRGQLDPEIFVSTNLARNRGSVAVDVGAHMGLYSYWFSKSFEKVHAFEPHPACVEFLRYLPSDIVEVHTAAVSDGNRDEVLRIPMDGNRQVVGLASLDARINADHESVLEIPVSTVRIDDLGLASVAVMKFDIEGHERAAIRGAAATIEESRPILVCEIEDRHLPSSSVAAEVLETCEMGFTAWTVGNDGSLERFIPEMADPESRRYRNNYIFQPVD